jgi:deoxyadenosine/deoxycytidine kinase
MSIIFSVEGNIGSGKSTLIKQLKKHMKNVSDMPIVYLEEPVDIWQQIKDKDGDDIIVKYYQDQKKYAFQFQMMAYITRITQLRKAIEQNERCIIITERSILTDRNVFAKMLHENNTLDEISHQIYLKWFDELSRNLEIHSLIYIKTKPETSLSRVLKRNRPGETIDLDYLQTCHNNHEEWILKEKNSLILDGEKEYKDNLPEKWLVAIRDYIYGNVQPLKELDQIYNILNDSSYPLH